MLHVCCHARPGRLLLEDERGLPHEVTAQELVAAIPENRRPAAVVLAGCSTALSVQAAPQDSADALPGLARSYWRQAAHPGRGAAPPRPRRRGDPRHRRRREIQPGRRAAPAARSGHRNRGAGGRRHRSRRNPGRVRSGPVHPGHRRGPAGAPPVAATLRLLADAGRTVAGAADGGVPGVGSATGHAADRQLRNQPGRADQRAGADPRRHPRRVPRGLGRPSRPPPAAGHQPLPVRVTGQRPSAARPPPSRPAVVGRDPQTDLAATRPRRAHARTAAAGLHRRRRPPPHPGVPRCAPAQRASPLRRRHRPPGTATRRPGHHRPGPLARRPPHRPRR